MTRHDLSNWRLGFVVCLGVGLVTVCWLVVGCATPAEPAQSEPPEASEIESPEPPEVDTDQPQEAEPEEPFEAEPGQPPEVDMEQPYEAEPEEPFEAEPGQPPEVDMEQPYEAEPEEPFEAEPGQPLEIDMEQPYEAEPEEPLEAEPPTPSVTQPGGPPAPPETEATAPSDIEAIEPSDIEAIEPSDIEPIEPSDIEPIEPSETEATEPSPPKPYEKMPPEDVERELERLLFPEGERTEPETRRPPLPGPGREPRQPGPPTRTEAGPPTRTEAAPPERLPTEPVMLTFNWRYAPWQDVLEWLAREAGLQLTYESMPPGTCNYVDNREYTLGEAMDVLNRLLLIKGYTLVRRDRLLVVVNMEDEIPHTLIRTVTPEELDELGESELVGVLFPLTKLTAEEAQTEIQNLVGPAGSIVPLPKSQMIWVVETGGRLRTIRDVLNRIEDPEGLASQQVRTFYLEFSVAEEVLGIVRQLLGIAADQNAAPDGSVRLAFDPLGMRLVVAGQPSKLDQVAKILEAINAPPPGQSPTDMVESALQVETYSTAPADPEVVLKVMQTLLAGSPGVRLSIDEMTGNLIALCRPSEHATIRGTLEQLIVDASGIVVIQLRYMDPTYAVTAIKTLFGTEEGSSKLKVDADATMRRLILRGSEKEIQQVRAFLADMGETGVSGIAGTGRGTVRTLPFPGRAAEAALEQLQQLWPAMRQNPIRVVRPSAVGASMRSSAPGQGAPPSGAPFDQLPRRESLTAPPPNEELVPQQLQPKEPVKQPPAGVSPATPPPAAGVPKAPEGLPAVSPGSKAESVPPSTAALPRRPRVFFASETLQPETDPEESVSGQSPTETTPPQTPPPEPAQPPAELPPASAEAPAPSAAEPAPIIVALVPGGIMIACQDEEALDAFENLLNTLASGASGPNIAVFYLKYARASVVAEMLTSILSAATSTSTTDSRDSGRGSDPRDRGRTPTPTSSAPSSLLELGSTITTSGPVHIQADDRLNALIVQASPADADRIWELLQILDQEQGPEQVAVEPTPHLIQLRYKRAEVVAEIVSQVFQERMVMGIGGRGGSPGARGGQMSPEQMMEMFRRSGGRGFSGSTRRGGTTQDSERMSIGVDSQTNTLIVWAPESLYRDVELLVRELDQEAAQTYEMVEVIPIRRSTSAAVQQALTAYGGDAIIFGGTGSSSGRPTESGAPSSGYQPSSSGYRPPFGPSSGPPSSSSYGRPSIPSYRPSSSGYRPSSSSYRPSSSSYRPSSSGYRRSGR